MMREHNEKSEEKDEFLYLSKQLVDWGYRYLPYDSDLLAHCLLDKRPLDQNHLSSKIMEQYKEKLITSINTWKIDRKKQEEMFNNILSLNSKIDNV